MLAGDIGGSRRRAAVSRIAGCRTVVRSPGARPGAVQTLVVAIAACATALASASAAPASQQLRLAFDNAHSQYDDHPRVLIWGRAQGLRYRYEVAGGEPATVRIEAVHRGSRETVRRWRHSDVEPGERRTVRWRGFANGRPAPGGRYFFRVVDADSDERASRRASSGRRAFHLRFHQFPLRGRVSWGDGWGAGRNHRGQDLFTNCGRPVRAARAGIVTWKRHQPGGAGYYLVIRGLRNNRYYVYMHLRKRRPVRVGERVNTGQRIGFVGATGNASGCHLHFELWRGRWFDGGRPMPAVTRQLRRWQRWSQAGER